MEKPTETAAATIRGDWAPSHPLADIFPMLAEPGLAELARDSARSG